MALHDALRERALANFELLLEWWKIDYRKITNVEYDLLAVWRADKNFGSCRFNVDKGRGADFAGVSFTQESISKFGDGFTSDDFASFTDSGQAKIGFDIIGLCQRVYRCNTYQDAIRYLNDDLRALTQDVNFINPTKEAIERRQKEQERKKKQREQWAKDIWNSASYHSLKGSLGEKYLNSRGLFKLDKNIRFHPSIQYAPTKTNYPALLFPIQASPTGEIQGIHRIFLSSDGTKAKVENPKMALANVKGGAIWFGEPSEELWIAEGPENSLTCLEIGASFVACGIYSSNIPNIEVPRGVTKIIVVPDPDPAGIKFTEDFITKNKLYLDLGTFTICKFDIPAILKPNNKFADINDIHMGKLHGRH